MKTFILMYCLLASNGHGYQECWTVPQSAPMHFEQCLEETEKQKEKYSNYKLVCWRHEDYETD